MPLSEWLSINKNANRFVKDGYDFVVIPDRRSKQPQNIEH